MKMKRTADIHKERNTAQTMVELAVFGGVLFFVIGAMTLNYISGSFQQNAQLQSMRQALLNSYIASKAGESSRTSASFLVFEDRLTGEFGKFGSLDRTPVVAMGSGMMSAQAMQISDWHEMELPVTDITVNGEHFVFRTDAWASYVIVLRNDGKVQIIHRGEVDSAALTQSTANGEGTCQYMHGGGGEVCYADSDCDADPYELGSCTGISYTTTTLTVDQVIADDVRRCLSSGAAGGYVINCNMGSEEQLTRLAWEWSGSLKKENMPPFFTAIVANDPDFLKTQSLTQSEKDTAYNLSRKKDAPIFPDGVVKPSWRWSWKYFKDLQSADTEGGERKTIQQKLIDKEVPFYSFDIDGDLQEESVYGVADITNIIGGGYCQAAYRVDVRDSELADIDPTKGPNDFTDPKQKPGIRPDLRIYGRTACVDTTAANCADDDTTYLEIKEGKLYSDGKQVAVSVLKKSQYDVVERAYQMNINMGDVGGFLKNNHPNVADGCGGENFKGTCFDSGTKTLYIRSRLSDQRGHKWITDLDKRTWGQSLGGK